MKANFMMISACVVTASLIACRCHATDVGPEGRGGEEKSPHFLDFLKGSREVRHPTDSNVIVRVVSEREERWVDDNTFVRRGLYVSKDGGRTWKNVNRQLVFDGAFFIHPSTGEWLASVLDTWLERNKEGFVEIGGGYKIVMSHDGEYWKDITRGTGHELAPVKEFLVDPDVPHRVLAIMRSEMYRRGCVLRSTGHEYSEWQMYGAEILLRLFPERYKKPAAVPESSGATNHDVIVSGDSEEEVKAPNRSDE